ncbi:orf 67 [Ateline gammaherpesvirus 3]|uniref:Orf 67 n=1 Tax=Ateline herpesvirus 3 TaxID=85618 RepID=Q9YTK0_ATHV3|nr:orf 67 [Ateline gammaherpesvirus 3]AAC95592.1 orf 67 [Ateline gammaherpesvirus 3]
MNSTRLVYELCDIVNLYLCQPGVQIDVDRCPGGPHVFTKGGSEAICTVKLSHGLVYNIEFVYKFWAHKLESMRYPFSPCFIISNNGLATTLKCFLSKPRNANHFGQVLGIESDVYLTKNTSVILSQDDFVKFKTNLVFSKDLDIFHSMVVFRTYLIEHRQTLQFLVVKPRNSKKVNSLLSSVARTANQNFALETTRRIQESHVDKRQWILSKKNIWAIALSLVAVIGAILKLS